MTVPIDAKLSKGIILIFFGLLISPSLVAQNRIVGNNIPNDLYSIISLLYDFNVKPIPPPPPPPNVAYFVRDEHKWVFHSEKDSMEWYNKVGSIDKDGRMAVAVNTTFKRPALDNYTYKGPEKVFTMLVDKLKQQMGGGMLNIDSLEANSKRRDSIIEVI